MITSPIDPIQREWTELPSIERSNTSYLGRAVSWLRGGEKESIILRLFKDAITAIIALLLVASIIGIPILVAGYKEWRAQEQAELPETEISARTARKLQEHSGSLFKKILSGNQAGCNGSVRTDYCAGVFAKLADLAPYGIRFNEEKLGTYVKDGNCSAMSLDFATEFLKRMPTGAIRLNSALEVIHQFSGKYFSRLGKNNPYTQEFRDRQAAFNCIEVDPLVPEMDFSRLKMQALANFHDLILTESSKELTFHYENREEERVQLGEVLESLPTGVYILRNILPCMNEKREQWGHSTIFIKAEDGFLLYDPNYGTHSIQGEASNALYNKLLNQFNDFEINQFRFHRLELP